MIYARLSRQSSRMKRLAVLLLVCLATAAGTNIKCGTSFLCSSEQPVTTDFSHDSSTTLAASPPVAVRRQMVQVAAQEAKEDIDRLFNVSEPLLSRTSSFVYNPLTTFGKSYEYVKDLSYSALISIGTSQRLRSFGLQASEIIFGLPAVDLAGTPIEQICPPSFVEECITGRYRMPSGLCNNVQQPHSGAAMEPFQRYLTADYADDISIPRQSRSGISLPAPREVSLSVFTELDSKHDRCTLAVMQWAQFVYNDIAQVAFTTGQKKTPLPCCDNVEHQECYPLNISASDPVYRGSSTCFPYSRSSPAPLEMCQLGPRQQVNIATSFLDASCLYGSSSTGGSDNSLRSFFNGKLLTRSSTDGSEFLPEDFESTFCQGGRCSKSGSHLVNILPTLTSLHTVWLREHNRIATTLNVYNPHWDDEKVFNEARKVVEAEVQHITFNEWLPMIVGKENIQNYGLELETEGYYSDYAINMNPSTLNSFASAAGLFFWSLLPKAITTYNEAGTPTSERPVSDYFMQGDAVRTNDQLEGFLRFMLRDVIDSTDTHFTDELTSKFLKGSGRTHGIDLASVIIHLGRDHGLPAYTSWREECGLQPVSSWTQLKNDLRESDLLPKLQLLYPAVTDADLFVMGMAEKPVAGGLVGPTFACIISAQFQKLRRADRFWYENFFFPSAFREEQLNEIRKVTLSRVICDNTKGIREVQPKGFMSQDDFEISAEPKVHTAITADTLQKAIELGRAKAREIERTEGHRIRIDATQTVRPGDPIFAHATLLSPTRESLDQARTARVLLETTKVLVRGTGLHKEEHDEITKNLGIVQLQKLLPTIDVSQIIGTQRTNETCVPRNFPCDHTSPYRTTTGWCNNLQFPHYGNSFSPFRRLLDPAYSDGFDQPRQYASDSSRLPSARAVSNAIHDIKNEDQAKYTHMLMQFGQFLDHDMTLTPIDTSPDNEKLNCSRCDSHDSISISCFPIEIPQDDPFFPLVMPDGSPRCLSFTRSLLGQLTLGYREQINQLSSYIDASTVYGSNECVMDHLRLHVNGKLNFTDRGTLREGLPQGDQERECRSVDKCFDAGDTRSNEQTALAAMHTIWLREHNRIATRLSRINNFWPDERIFQETRRIVSAMIQHISYNEFLPKTLGMETMAKYGLLLKKKGYYEDYDRYCDASVSNAFASAAFRFGHSLIRSHFDRMDDFFNNFSEPLQLRHMFMNTTPLFDTTNGGLDTIMLGLAGVHCNKFDRFMTEDIRHHLFEIPGRAFSGMDLAALNIQRARDHGLPAYNYYRQFCGLSRARSFADLADVMQQDAIDSLRRVYRNVDDIDLFPGIMAEEHLRGALVGHTAACIIAEQFQRLRKCDRFWYENDVEAIKFTPDQLAQIRKVTLAKVICTNSQFIRKIQPNIFDMPDDLLNNQVACQDLPEIDLYDWLDRQFCVVDHRVINRSETKRITPCVSCTCTAEGPECHSVRIRNCYQLLDEFLLQEVKRDTVCVVQCSAAIKRRSGSLSINDF